MSAVREEDRYQVWETKEDETSGPIFSSSSQKTCEKVAAKGNKMRKPDQRFPFYQVRDRFA